MAFRANNAEISEMLAHIGKLLQLRGENVFKIRAYERASLTLSSYPKDLGSVYGEGGTKALKEIPGIGIDLAFKIEEMLKTGKIKYVKQIEKGIPKGVIELMEIPGLGPKKTLFLWKKFKIAGAADLKKLIASGKLQKLKGWGDKSAENIIKNMAFRQNASTRIAIGKAFEIAESILNALKETGLTNRLEIAGSLRRRKETIGDIDLLATSDRAEKLLNAFCKLPFVKTVIARGPTKASIRVSAGVQVDLRVLPDELFGAALYYFTGSKEHNVATRSIAVRNGITISEYGVFRGTAEKKGKLLASKTEEEVFAAIGLPYIPPELRENRGEVEAAKAGKLPRLIEQKDIRGDLHVHSVFSDGSSTMTEMARAAKERGYEYIGFADHGSPMGMVKGIKKENISQYLKEIEKARKAVPGIHIFAGVEVDILADGRLYLPDDVLKHLDVVVASVHQNFQMSSEEMTERFLKALSNPHVTILGHPTTRLLPRRGGIIFDIDAVFTAAKKNNVALELNASPERLDLDDVLSKRAKDMGILLSIDSDAHAPQDLDMRFGIGQARRAWLEPSDVLTAQPLRKLLEFLQ